MELSSGEGNRGSVIPLSVNNSCHIGVGSAGEVESNSNIEPEMYDFSSFLEGDIVDAVFLELKELLKAASLPSIDLVVSKMVEEVVASKNMEHHVQPSPSPPPPSPPPQLPRPNIVLRTNVSGSIKWTEELHAVFVDAVRQLGGAFVATPKTVLDIMRIEGLNLHQVKSHLQKYRTEKRLCEDLQKMCKRGSSFSRALGAPTNPATSSKPPPKRQRRSRAKVKKQERGSLHSKLQFRKQVQQLLEMQRQYADSAASRLADYQTMGRYASTAHRNMGVYPFAANQNIGGHVLSLNQNIGGRAVAGMRTYPENSFMREATMTPMQSYYPLQLNPYNGYTSAAAMHAGTFIPQKPDELQRTAVAYPHQLTQASFPEMAGSGSSQQGFNSDAGESSGTAGMSDEEFVESFLVDFDELIVDFQDNQ